MDKREWEGNGGRESGDGIIMVEVDMVDEKGNCESKRIKSKRMGWD